MRLKLLLWSILLSLGIAYGGSAWAFPRVVVIDLDHTSLSEWLSEPDPVWQSLLRQGGLALANSNTADGPNSPSADLTLGASAHAHGAGIGLAFDKQERLGKLTAAQIFALNGGSDPGEIVDLGLGNVISQNAHLPYQLQLGALGEALHQANLRTAVLGNSDQPDPLRPPAEGYHREAVAIAMDTSGRVDLGDVSDDLLKPAAAPYGLEVDNQRLLSAWLKASPASLTVIDYGDTARADSYRAQTITSRAANRLSRAAMDHFAAFLRLLRPHLDLHQTDLIILAPAPSQAAIRQGSTLTPILAVGPDFSGGFLTSATTHRPGLVANIDLAPTILRILHLPVPVGFFGQPVRSVAGTAVGPRLLNLGQLIAFNSSLRLPVMKTMVYIMVAIFALTMLYLGFPHRRRLVSGTLLGLLEGILYLPLALLLLGAFHWENPLSMVGFLVLVPVLGILLSHRLSSSPFSVLLTPMLLTVLALVVDLYRGSPMMQFSLLGYDPQIGARYYGIGNEFMGVMIGASTVGFGLLLQHFARTHWVRWPVMGFLALIDLFMVLPGMGTKAGAAITATAAFGVMALKLTGRRVRLAQALGLAVGIVLLLGLLIALDLTLHGANHRTDIGRAALLIYHGGLEPALLIISRKLQTNLSLLRGSYWSLILLASLVILALGVTNRLGARPLFEHNRLLWAGFVGAGVGVVVGFFFNDTGVVAASTALIYPLTTLLWLALAELPAEPW